MTQAWLIWLLPLAWAQAAHAADAPRKSPPAKQQPDIKFLEYLGTMEADDENWTDVAATVLAEQSAKQSDKLDAKQESTAKPVVKK